MLNFVKQQSLAAYNTFGFDVKARHFTEVSDLKELDELIETDLWQNNRHLIIGGGSNLLLRANFDGLVVVNRIKGITVINEQPDALMVKVGGGENWHNFVMHCVDNNWGGVENLSLIPGTVGAAPMQNIGAYGVEIKEVFHSLEAFNLQTGSLEIFSAVDCHFGYRESVFKNRLKDKYLIVSVTFKLSKPGRHKLMLEYGAIKEVLQENKITSPGIKEVSDAVIQIRQSKLPDPAEIGNSGSFFKNPILSRTHYDQLKDTYPDLPGYKVSDEDVKVAAGWLIEQAGWKGHEENGVGVHEKQALVLVNKGTGSGAAIAELAKKIQDSVSDKFGIKLSPEVNFI